MDPPQGLMVSTRVVCFFVARRGGRWCDALRFSGFLCSFVTLIGRCIFYTVGSKFGLWSFCASIGLFLYILWAPSRPACAPVWVSLFWLFVHPVNSCCVWILFVFLFMIFDYYGFRASAGLFFGVLCWPPFVVFNSLTRFT